MDYLVVGFSEDNPEHEIGRFKAKSDGEAFSIFWKEYASNLRCPDCDLMLYRVNLWGKRTFITSDY